MHEIKTDPKKFGYYNVTVAAYDLFYGYTLMDSIAVPFEVKVYCTVYRLNMKNPTCI